MNAIAAYILFEHLERTREEAWRERRARPVSTRPSAARRLVSALGGVLTQARAGAQPAA